MNAIALFTGGKDSTLALNFAIMQGLNIDRLITIIPKVKDSFMYHTPNITYTEIIATAIDIPIDIYRIDDDIQELKHVIDQYTAKVVISGAIKSEYQKTRIEQVCTELDKISYTPLWHKDEYLLLKELINAHFEVYIDAIAAEGMGPEFLGAVLDQTLLEKLIILRKKYKINISGEGGEYETIVLNAPFFKTSLKITNAVKEWHGSWGVYIIKKLEYC